MLSGMRQTRDPNLVHVSSEGASAYVKLCKVMERMFNNRLAWCLERNKLKTPLQCGFRKQRSTTDHFGRLESFIREAFIQRLHAIAVFFDLKKEYDCTWKYDIMKDHHEACLRGRLLCVLKVS